MTKFRPPKKSEFLEVRIPHAAKVEFMDACRRDGRSASEVVREMIERRLAPRRTSLARRVLVVAALAAAALGGAVAPSLARPAAHLEFDRIDANHDGLIDRAEFSR